MRLKRLGLTAFGKFTDAALDFGDRPVDGPDLHIVYGPNEAGKSTIYAAMLDFFFGIPEKSKFNFKHPYSAMRIEGSVVTDAGETVLARIKRRNNDLLDGADQPLAVNPFAAGLAGLDRGSYAAMFSLNEASLTEGGKSLLAAEGDFGRILYGASAGLTDFGKELDAVIAETEAFHKVRAQKTTLRNLAHELDALAKEKARIDTLAPEYENLCKTKAMAAAALIAAEAAEYNAQMASAKLQNQAKALEYLSEYKELQAKLEPLQDLPEAPAGLDAEITRLREEAAALKTESIGAAEALKALEGKIGAIKVDEAALAQADALASLLDLAGRYRGDAGDLPRRLEDRTALQAQIATRAERLTGAAVQDAGALLLTPSVKGRLLELMDAWPALHARLQAAETEVEGAAIASPGDILEIAAKAELEAALKAYEASDASARTKVAAGRVAERKKASQGALAALAAWYEGAEAIDVTAIRRISPPSAETLSRWRQALNECVAAMKRAQTEASEASARAAEKRAQIDVIINSNQLVDGVEFTSLLKSRDAAWQRHRSVLDDASADAFERLLEKTDAAHTARVANASAVARAAAAQEAMAIAEAQAAAAVRRGADAESALKETQSSIKKFAQSTDSESLLCLDQLDAWMASRAAWIAAADALDQAETERHSAEHEADCLRRRFMALLGIEGSLPALVTLARSRLEADSEARSAAQQLTRREEDLAKRRSEEAAWREKWLEALNGTWLAPLEASVESVKAAIADHDALAVELAALSDLQRRIDGIEDNLTAFRKGLRSIHDALDEDFGEAEPLQAYAALQARIKQEETQNAERIRLEGEIDAVMDRRQSLEAKLLRHKHEVSEFIKSIGANDLLTASQVLSEIQARTQLRDRSSQAARAILDHIGGDDIAVAVASLDALDRNTLAADIEAAQALVQTAKADALQSYTANRDADQALDRIGGDAAAAAIVQRRQTIIEQMTDGAKTYLRLKLGAMAAAEALEQYRASHQSGMLAGASAAFAEITRGAYSGLKTQSGGKGEELIALTADGASRLDDASMSTGTRAQLYLALRIAAYHEFAARQAPPPFVADDIFETFDDGRAEVTFKLLGEMAGEGQVIYFTHHKHLQEIAERAVPGAHWLDMTALL